MENFSLFEYLQTFGVDKNFFDSASRSRIGYVNGVLGFKSKNRSLLSRFKKQFIPIETVFPQNRKKIYLSLDASRGGRYIDRYGIGSPMQVEKNYSKALLEISSLIHKKIKKKISNETVYEEANEDLGIFYKYNKILEKHKIYSIYYSPHIPEDLDYTYHKPKEHEKYVGEREFFTGIFSNLNEAHFNYPYKEDSKRHLGTTDYFYLKYKKYSFFINLDSLTDHHLENIKIKL